jgi:hypothetical protein
MSIFETLGGKVIDLIDRLIGGSNDSSSTSNHSSIQTYEPDKLKIAEIEQATQIMLADKDFKRIELMKEAKLEMIREEGNFKIALEKAHLHGLIESRNIILQMQERFSELSRQRIEIIQHGTMSVIEQAENFYQSLKEKLNAEDNEFDKVRLPQLFEQLDKFPADSFARQSYQKRIESLIDNQIKIYSDQLFFLCERQQKVIESINQTKDSIVNHTNALEEKVIEHMMRNAMPLIIETKEQVEHESHYIGN